MSYAIQAVQLLPQNLLDISLDTANIQGTGATGGGYRTAPLGPIISAQTAIAFASTTGANNTYVQDTQTNTCIQVAQTTAGTIYDLYTGYCCPFTPQGPSATGKAVRNINMTFFRAEILMAWSAAFTGAGMVNQDSGVFVLGANGFASGRLYNESDANSADQNIGFGLQADRATGQYKFLSKQVSGIGNAFALNTLVGAPAAGITAPHLIDIRIAAATPSAAASLSIFMDGVQVVGQSWGAGTKLPGTIAGGLFNGTTLQVGVRNCNSTLSTNPNLLIYGFRVRIGSQATCTLDNDF